MEEEEEAVRKKVSKTSASPFPSIRLLSPSFLEFGSPLLSPLWP